LLVSFAVLLVGLAGCGPGPTSDSEQAARIDPTCHLLCTILGPADGSAGRTTAIEGAQRKGPAEGLSWGLWDNWGPDRIHVRGSRDVDQVWTSGLTVPGGDELHRVDVMQDPFQPAGAGTARSGQLIYTRQRFTGKWAPCCGAFGVLGPPVKAGPGRPIPSASASDPTYFTGVSIAGVREELHVCALARSLEAGDLWHIYRRNNRTAHAEAGGFDDWSNWTDIKRMTGDTSPLRFRAVSCASVRNPTTGTDDLHVCAVGGKLVHAIGSGDLSSSGFSKWTGFSDVGTAARIPAGAIDVDCAGNRGQLHMVVTTVTGVWHTIRNPSGVWAQATNVVAAAGMPPGVTRIFPGNVAIGFCNDGVRTDGGSDYSQLNVAITNAYASDPIYHTVRSTNPIAWTEGAAPSYWKPATDLRAETNAPTSHPSRARYNSWLIDARSIAERPFSPISP
jgi:hypothetical protein